MLKYSTLKEKIAGYIRTQKLSPGDRIPGVRELLKKYNVSRSTLSHALELLTRDELLERRHGSGLYVKNTARRETTTIGLILTEAENPFLNRFLHELTIKNKHALSIITKVSAFDPARERNAADELVRAGAQGILLLPEPTEKNKRYFENMMDRGIRIVNVLRTFTDTTIPSVIPDNFAAGKLAAERLIRNGCRELGYIGNRLLKSTDERYRGFSETALASGIAMNRRREVFLSNENTIEAGFRSCEQLLTQMKTIDGIMTFHDIYAAGVIRLCHKRGIRIPGDIRLIGCDNLDIADYLTPSLTSIDYGSSMIAANALKLVTGQMDGTQKRCIIQKPKIIVRESA
ncbi:MAG: substrate-binding domain-containing protein [Spirochaetes bacterium]|nr:substrate-binding domain-containing protein [Spirochaetota bacterium]